MINEELPESTDKLSDTEIVRRVLAGDTGSFELIMRRYNRRLYRIVRGVLRDAAEAEDAVQDAYVRAFENLVQFRAQGPFSAWLARIALNEALGRVRGSEAALNSVSLDDEEQGEEANYMAQMVAHQLNPEQDAARKEVQRLLESAIDALPSHYRLAFILFGVEGMSVAEAAECLDVEPATVKTRYHRARKLLQQQLSGLVDSSAGELYSFDGVRCDRIVTGVFRKIAERSGS